MTYIERATTFECHDDTLVGIASVPETATSSTGVLIIVGGPQYRVGSHRQFVLLSRTLAEHGIPCMRFDCRGMGDATGNERSFEAIDNDIRKAIDRFLEMVPGVERVVLWGLCDGASAACFYAPRDVRVASFVLLNPWVRTESGEAKTYLKHYYARRLFERDFWKKLFGQQVSISESISNFLRALRLARRQANSGNRKDDRDLPTRMADNLVEAGLPMLIVLSGNDYVANEFDEVCREHSTWASLMTDATVTRLDNADHTFSKSDWRDAVAKATADWVLRDAISSTAQHSDEPET